MSAPRDFIPVRLRHVDARYGRKVLREIKAAERARGVKVERGRYFWAGPAAESALVHAINIRKAPDIARLADTLRYDFEMRSPSGRVFRCEVKTRVAESGWVHPERFDWISVPLHGDREPVKPESDLVLFCWWSADAPRILWVVGMLRGLEAFQRTATFYGKGEALPRGGFVHGEGTYQLEVAKLAPVPRGLFKEMKDV